MIKSSIYIWFFQLIYKNNKKNLKIKEGRNYKKFFGNFGII